MRFKRVMSIGVLLIVSLTINGCVTPDSKKQNGDDGSSVVTEAFNKGYLEYKKNRPGTEPVNLDPKLWTLMPSIDDEKMKDINQKAKYLSMIYKLSTLYTDMFFSDAEISNYISKKKREWKDKMKSDEFKSASVKKIEREYETFINAIDDDAEFKAIQKRLGEAKKEFTERAKELGKDIIVESLKKYLDAKGLLQVKPQEDMNYLQKAMFAKSLTTEASKVDEILSQAAYTTNGTLLVAGKATATVILATLKVADVIVTIALDSTGKILVTAADATGKAVELAIVGGNYVLKSSIDTSKYVLKNTAEGSIYVLKSAAEGTAEVVDTSLKVVVTGATMIESGARGMQCVIGDKLVIKTEKELGDEHHSELLNIMSDFSKS